ncbi:MAG: glycosyltransferase family 2 protein [Bacteroidaceae bacterium]|nr:glycosyltransferase family 2 protein [Bacteroidaceae bacterium]
MANTKETVDISVIIPCYNRVQTIGKAIDSILLQDFDGRIEIIVSDDGSTDGSLEYIRKEYFSKVVVLEKPKDCLLQGASGTRNRGIEIANGRYICFLDSDDYYKPNFCSTLWKVLEENPRLGYVFCAVEQEVFNNGHIESRRWTKDNMKFLDKKYHVLYSANCIWTGCIMCRLDSLKKTGFFNTNFLVGEDTDLWLRLSEESDGSFINKCCSVYCISGFADNQLTEKESSRKNIFAVKVMEEALSRYNKNHLTDRIRLFLIRKNLIILKLTKKKGLLYSIYRQAIVHFCLLIRMPLTFIRYIGLRFVH